MQQLATDISVHHNFACWLIRDARNLAQDAHNLAQDACNLAQDARNLAQDASTTVSVA